MSRKFALLSLIAVYFGEAAVPPCTTTVPPAVSTTTPACGDLCKGLVGSAAGLAGLGAIGGIVAATMGTKKPTAQPPSPTPAPTLGPTVAPTTVTRTVRPDLMVDGPRGSDPSDSSGSWLWPLLLGLLALCCLGALLGFLCMGKPKKAKRTTKVKKLTAAPVVVPEPEAAPLSGHYEQPMMTVPVATTTTPSYTPTMYETVAPIATTAAYLPMAAQSYMPMAVPTYGMAPTIAAPMYGTSQIV